MDRWELKIWFLYFGFVLLFEGCSSSKNYETRTQCMDRCVREQYVCALALAPQLDNAAATTVTCVSLYMICYEKCPVTSSRSGSYSRSSSSSSGGGNSGGGNSSSGSGSGSSSSSGGGN
ncbi:hypothetical protein EHQ24_14390 [Leptospira noumeaensis]|uniref:Uncharacterized protein n=1 Tax=Leptospira noumeaensis TaxID=2484964 RepID=A0A4V3JJY9_9LEPT|nr:hypothetical protein [Leptospira noumeaensis]TGK82434.1 hypothetical protein EHQ24_14390 [Leptospira noumeaensis]